jgi:hypothetical protein
MPDLIHISMEHEARKKVRQNLTLLSTDDKDEELLYKHWRTVDGYINNFRKFPDAVFEETKSEDLSLNKLVSAGGVKQTQEELNRLYREADVIKDKLLVMLEESGQALSLAIFHEEEVKNEIEQAKDNKSI